MTKKKGRQKQEARPHPGGITERNRAALAELGQRALAGGDLASLSDEALALVTEVLEVENSSILEFVQDGKAFLVRAAVGWLEGVVGQAIVDVEIAGQTGSDLQHGKPVVVEDLRTDERFNLPRFMRDAVPAGTITTVIRNDDRPFGVLSAGSRRPRRFSGDDIDFLQAVANVLAEATQRQRAEEVLQRARDELELRAERTAELRKVNQRLRKEITERKRAEEALRESEAILRATLEATADGILVVDDNAQVLHANARFAEMWRIPKHLLETCDARKLRLFVADQLDDPAAFLSRLRDLYETPEETFDTLSLKDGRLFERLSRPLMIEAQVAGGVGSFRDVTERKRAEEALRESEERYRSIYTKTPAMLHSIDTDGRLVAVSDQWLEAFGYERDEVIGRKSVEFLTDDSRRFAETVSLPRFWKVGSARDVAYQFVKKNGEVADVLLSAVVERDGAGNVVRTLAVLNDVTERNRLEEALQRARETLEGKVERQMLQRNPYRLTFREFTVLHLVATGRADKEIAGELVISPLTVHKHVANILAKMNAASRTEAGVRALREGWLD